ncbi:MAG: hypothetical protein LBF59_03250 [Prevotellaceae bacterium]|nr:hypothetical protein [Prevotellaceae bacterium]
MALLCGLSRTLNLESIANNIWRAKIFVSLGFMPSHPQNLKGNEDNTSTSNVGAKNLSPENLSPAPLRDI